MTDSKKPAAKTSSARKSQVWTEVERAAMAESARERKAAARRGPGDARAQGELDVRAKIDEMAAADRVLAERIHALVSRTAPTLVPRTWYGMPAYANDGKVICFFQAASKFKVRYATLGFQPDAMLDDGSMWPVAWAVVELTASDESMIAALIKKAIG